MLSKSDYNNLNNRVEKVTNALYKVTDLLPDKEPAKWILRSSGVNFLLELVSLNEKSTSEKIASFSKIFEYLSRVIYTLEIAGLSGFVSGINFEILKKEYEEIKNLIESGREDEAVSYDNIVSDTLTDIQTDKIAIGQSIKTDKGQITFNNSLAVNKGVSKRVNNKNRSEKILSFVGGKGWVTIKDISYVFSDLNQKTIQRELLFLVTSGALKKEGDKRWRRYSIA